MAEIIKKSDYTILTEEQRDVIRLTLVKVLENKIKQVVSGKVTIENGAADFIAIQKNVGENFKTYEDKLEALNMCLEIN